MGVLDDHTPPSWSLHRHLISEIRVKVDFRLHGENGTCGFVSAKLS